MEKFNEKDICTNENYPLAIKKKIKKEIQQDKIILNHYSTEIQINPKIGNNEEQLEILSFIEKECRIKKNDYNINSPLENSSSTNINNNVTEQMRNYYQSQIISKLTFQAFLYNNYVNSMNPVKSETKGLFFNKDYNFYILLLEKLQKNASSENNREGASTIHKPEPHFPNIKIE